MIQIGSIIRIEGKRYRVLMLENKIARVMYMDNDIKMPMIYDLSIVNETDYFCSAVDGYLNGPWFNSLGIFVRNAIVPEFAINYFWKSHKVSANKNFTGRKDNNGTYTLSETSHTITNKRNIRCVNLNDILAYLKTSTNMTAEDTLLTVSNLRNLFTDSPAFLNEKIWTMSQNEDNKKHFYVISLKSGDIKHDDASSAYIVRPVFRIDLSKVLYQES